MKIKNTLLECRLDISQNSGVLVMNTLSLNLGSYAGSARGNYGYAGGNYRGGFNSPVNDNNYAQYSTAENYTMQLQLIQKYNSINLKEDR